MDTIIFSMLLAVFINLTKAFNRVIAKLLRKMSSLGFKGPFLKLLES